MWYKKACDETHYLREPLVDLAMLEYKENNYAEIKKYCLKALKIKEKYKSYINEPFCWDSTIDDLLALAYFYTNDYYTALEYVNRAIEKDPNNERLKNNKKIITSFLK